MIILHGVILFYFSLGFFSPCCRFSISIWRWNTEIDDARILLYLLSSTQCITTFVCTIFFGFLFYSFFVVENDNCNSICSLNTFFFLQILDSLSNLKRMRFVCICFFSVWCEFIWSFGLKEKLSIRRERNGKSQFANRFIKFNKRWGDKLKI